MSRIVRAGHLGELTQAGNHGGSGYPLMRVVALVACGIRSVIDAVFGPTGLGEGGYTPAGWCAACAGTLVLLDRNFDNTALLGHLTATDADLLVRLKSNRTLPILRRLPNGPYGVQSLSVF